MFLVSSCTVVVLLCFLKTKQYFLVQFSWLNNSSLYVMKILLSEGSTIKTVIYMTAN